MTRKPFPFGETHYEVARAMQLALDIIDFRGISHNGEQYPNALCCDECHTWLEKVLLRPETQEWSKEYRAALSNLSQILRKIGYFCVVLTDEDGKEREDFFDVLPDEKTGAEHETRYVRIKDIHQAMEKIYTVMPTIWTPKL